MRPVFASVADIAYAKRWLCGLSLCLLASICTAAVTNPTRITGSNAIDPIGSASATNSASSATLQNELESYPDFGAIQDFSGLTDDIVNGTGYIFEFGSRSLPDIRLTYAGSAGGSITINNSTYATSGSSSLRLQPTGKGTITLTIELGTYSGGAFTASGSASRKGVHAVGFTLSGAAQNLQDKITVKYYDAADNVLSTQQISSTAFSYWYTGHAATNGQDPITKITISYTVTTATPGSIGLDDLGFSFYGTELIPKGASLATHTGNFEVAGSAGRGLGWSLAGGVTGATTSLSTINPQGPDRCQQVVIHFGSDYGINLQRAGISYKTGYYYASSVWLRADSTTDRVASVSMRDNIADSAKQPHAVTTVALGTSWQKVTVAGWGQGDAGIASTTTYAGQFRVDIAKDKPGTYFIDSASVMEIEPDLEQPSLNAEPVESRLFGIHLLNAYQLPSDWPGDALPFKNARLWGVGEAMWRNLMPNRPSPNNVANIVWDTGKLVSLKNRVDRIRSAASLANDVDIVLTLGMTPSWAAVGSDTADSPYGLGSNFPPKDEDLVYWDEYVRKLARELKGKVRYWEIWNEPDYKWFWRGNMKQLADMAERAYNILHNVDNVDPGIATDNIVISPGFTKNTGMDFLESYFYAGGHAYSDYIGYHFYPHPEVEHLVNHMRNVREVTRQYGIGSKPIWDTESGWDRTAPNQPGHLARMFLTRWGNGVYRNSYYGYDVERTALTTPVPDGSPDGFNYQTLALNAAGDAYVQVSAWLIGATVVKQTMPPAVTGGPWIVELSRPGVIGYKGYAVWHPTATGAVSFNIPVSWGITRKRTITNSTVTPHSTSTVLIDQSPILLENRAP